VDTFATTPPGRRLSVYATLDVLELLEPWAAGRQRSARVATICSRYGSLASQQPGLTLAEWGVVAQLLGGLATLDQAKTLWAVLQDEARDGRSLPGIEPERLASRLHAMTGGELLAMLEIADKVSLAQGSIRERLALAGVRASR
jgi:hypothetical protein